MKLPFPRRKEDPAPARVEPVLLQREGDRVPMIMTKSDAREVGRAKADAPMTFKAPVVMPGAAGGAETLAMDSNYPVEMAAFLNNAFADGVAFLGYPRLAEMAQRVEYRHIVGTLSEEATREWIEFRGKAGASKSERIKELDAEFERLNVRAQFRKACDNDGYYGIGWIYLNTGLPPLDPRLANPLLIDPVTFRKGELQSLVVIDPIWTSPNEYNSDNPLRNDFYVPTKWWVQGATVHHTRMLRIVSREVPNILAPTYNFGGVALTQLAKPYVDNWVRTRQSVSDLINGCSIVNLKTEMQAVYANCGIDGLISRVENFQKFRDNRGVFLTDKQNEELQILSANLASLDKLQNQSFEQICMAAKMPLVKFSGISPSGLNASSEGEVRIWYDNVAAYQEAFIRPALTTVMHAAMLNIWGEIDPDIFFKFVPLWQLDEAAQAAIAKTKADTRAVYEELGAVSNDEIRAGLRSDPDGLFDGANLDGPGYEPLAKQEGRDTESAGITLMNNPAAHTDNDGV